MSSLGQTPSVLLNPIMSVYQVSEVPGALFHALGGHGNAQDTVFALQELIVERGNGQGWHTDR